MYFRPRRWKCLFFPKGVHKRFEKTRSRMVCHAIRGLGDLPNKREKPHYDIIMPRLRELSELKYYRNFFLKTL
jgi:hypothetical protein